MHYVSGRCLAVTSLRTPKEALSSEGMERPEHSEGTTISWSEDFACPEHGAFMPELSPRLFIQLTSRCMPRLSGPWDSTAI